MKCKGCHAEIQNRDKLYCEECSLKRKRARRILNIVLPIVFIIFMGLGIKLAFFMGGPDKLLREFLTALKDRDYKAAYSLFDERKLKENQLLTLKDFEASFMGSEVTDYKITVKNTNYNASEEMIEYDVLMKQGPESRHVKIEVAKTLVKNKTNWRIDPLSFTVKTSIMTLGKLDVKVNGQTIPPREYGDYNLMTFKNTPVTITLSHGDLTPLEQNGTSGETFTLLSVEPSASIKNGAMEIVKNFKTAWFQSLKDYSLSHIDPYVSHSSSKWQTITGYIDYIKSKSENHSETLLDLQIKGVEFAKELGKCTLNRVLVTTLEKSQKAKGIQESTSWIYELEKMPDSSWLITNYYIKD